MTQKTKARCKYFGQLVSWMQQGTEIAGYVLAQNPEDNHDFLMVTFDQGSGIEFKRAHLHDLTMIHGLQNPLIADEVLRQYANDDQLPTWANA